MAKSKKAAPQLKVPAEPITEFEVTKGGTLRMADYVEAETRAEFYEDVAGRWEGSPQDLSDAMDECQPLAWAVNSIYSDFRDEIVADIGAAEPDAKQNKRRIAVLKERLKKLPEEPEEGASIWLLGLTTSEFEANVVPQIQEWFSEPPDWNFEDDYLPQTGTAQGAALEFFRRMDADSVDLLGVDIVEGEHPGSTYYAAELRGDIEAANTAAISCGLAVRFVRHGQAVERTRQHIFRGRCGRPEVKHLRTSANRFNPNSQDDPQQVSRPRFIQRTAHPANRRRGHPQVFASNRTCGLALLPQIQCSVWRATKLAGSLPPNTPASVVRVGTREPGATA